MKEQERVQRINKRLEKRDRSNNQKDMPGPLDSGDPCIKEGDGEEHPIKSNETPPIESSDVTSDVPTKEGMEIQKMGSHVVPEPAHQIVKGDLKVVQSLVATIHELRRIVDGLERGSSGELRMTPQRMSYRRDFHLCRCMGACAGYVFLFATPLCICV